MSPLEALLTETRERLGKLDEVRGVRSGDSYRITLRKGRSTARARLRAGFWEGYLASGRTDHCGCVDHFFAHLRKNLGTVTWFLPLSGKKPGDCP